jgi:hypothetical protein
LNIDEENSAMGEARRRKHAQQVGDKALQEAVQLIAQEIWEKSDKAKVDEMMVTLMGQGLQRADIAALACGMIAHSWGEALDREPSLFLSALSHLVLGIRQGHVKALEKRTADAAERDAAGGLPGADAELAE